MLYEGSVLGFFSMIAASMEGGLPLIPRALRPWQKAQDDLFATLWGRALEEQPEGFFPTDEGAARKLLRSLENAEPRAREALEYAFRSERPLEAQAIAYARLALGGRRESLRDESRPEVRAVNSAWRVSLRELDRFRGIMRFQRSPRGRWEADCEPEADIVDLLPPHFQARLGGEAFLIRDLKRGKAVQGGERTAPVEAVDGLGLWKRYYRVIENESRKNDALRKRFLPERYWKNLPELSPPPSPLDQHPPRD